MGSDWFATRELPNRVFLIAEPGHVNSFLVVGSERAALIDSGLGIDRIRPVAESLTNRPIEVVNTHYHWDHVGGNREFDRTAIHELGAEALAAGASAEELEPYLSVINEVVASVEPFRAIDERVHAFMTDETTPRPLPDGFDPGAWTLRPRPPTRQLQDGDEIDLGDRSLQVLHTPGHTPDCICLLDEFDGALFGGDTINTGPIYGHMRDSSLEDFAASTARVAELAGDVHVVYVAHFSRYAADARFLVEVANGFADIVEGRAVWRDNTDVFGEKVREAVFPTVSVFLSPVS